METNSKTPDRPDLLPGAVCPLELEPGATYFDTEDGSTFTVGAIEVLGVQALIHPKGGGRGFHYGGLYRGLRQVVES